MKVVIIHGQAHKGSTYHVAKLLADKLKAAPEDISEFQTNAIKPCVGCFTCIMKDEALCPQRANIGPIIEAMEKADVIIAESPNYCMGMSGQLKMLFDHLAYRWLSHRPHPDMKNKIGVGISTTAGLGAGKAAKSIASQLFWLGAGRTYHIAETVAAMSWDGVSAKNKAKIEKDTDRLAKKINTTAGKVKQDVKGKFMFGIMRFQHKKFQWIDADTKYWKQNGWI